MTEINKHSENNNEGNNIEGLTVEGDINGAAFEAFDRLAKINEELEEVRSRMDELFVQRQSGVITQAEFNAAYEPLMHNDLEYLVSQKERLEAIITPAEVSGVRKLARGVMGVFRHK